MLHQASGRWKLGLLLALVTAACWATLPVALKMSLSVLDPMTLTWFRFAFAAVFMGLWLLGKRRMAVFGALQPKQWRWLLLATVLLIGNYIGYLLGVKYTSPGNAQLLIQLAPLLMALGGVFIFRERFVWGQWLGLLIIVLGSWAAYALMQKQLLLKLSSQHILAVIYLFSALLLWPFAHPSALADLNALHWALLLYCALNTLVAYGAFAEALEHWQASRVSAVLATTPMLCLGVVALVHAFWPEAVASEHVGLLGFAGAVLVVVGSALSSLLGQRPEEKA